MHTSLSFFVSAIGFGLAYSAAPGAVNTETIRRGVRHGYRPAVLVELGALIGDGFWAALALTGSAFLLRSPSIWLALGFVGAGFLLRLAWRALHEAWRGSVPRARGETARGNFSTGIAFSIANPFGLAFWSGVGTGLVATETGGTAPARFTLLLAGFLCGSLLWCLGFPLLISWGRRYVGAALFQIINGICGVALGYFGGRLLWNTAQEAWERAPALVRRLPRYALRAR